MEEFKLKLNLNENEVLLALFAVDLLGQVPVTHIMKTIVSRMLWTERLWVVVCSLICQRYLAKRATADRCKGYKCSEIQVLHRELYSLCSFIMFILTRWTCVIVIEFCLQAADQLLCRQTAECVCLPFSVECTGAAGGSSLYEVQGQPVAAGSLESVILVLVLVCWWISTSKAACIMRIPLLVV